MRVVETNSEVKQAPGLPDGQGTSQVPLWCCGADGESELEGAAAPVRARLPVVVTSSSADAHAIWPIKAAECYPDFTQHANAHLLPLRS